MVDARKLALATAMWAASACHGGPWASPSGSAASFSFANGQDLHGRFGEPVVSGDTLRFPEFHLVASVADGDSLEQHDVVSFDVVPRPGLAFGTLRVFAVGYYEMSGPEGENRVDLRAGTGISVSENGGLGRTFAEFMITEPKFPQSGGSSGWRGLAAVEPGGLDPPLFESLHVEFSAGVLALSGPDGTAHLEMQLLSGLSFTFVPEPGTAALLLVAAALAALWHGHPARES